MQWTTTSQQSQTAGAKVLVYAEAGTGKTMLCATAPRPVIISAESGLRSLSRQNIERVFGVGTPGITYDIPVIQIRTLAELDAAYSYFANDPTAAQHFSTLCFDSLSELAEVCLAAAKLTNKDPRKAYGEMADAMVERVKKYRDLSQYHCYMTAKLEVGDTGAGVMRQMPGMPGKQLGAALPYLFDEMFYLGVNQNQDGTRYRFIQTDADLQRVAKDRSGLLAPVEQPHLGYIFHKMTGASA